MAAMLPCGSCRCTACHAVQTMHHVTQAPTEAPPQDATTCHNLKMRRQLQGECKPLHMQSDPQCDLCPVLCMSKWRKLTKRLHP